MAEDSQNENCVDPLDIKVPRGPKFAYAFASGSVVMLMIVLNSWTNIYYTDVIGVSENSLAIIWLVFLSWNMINDPLFGYIMDRTKTKWGRRIPYIMIFSPFLTISFILLWTPPLISGDGEFSTVLYFTIMLFVFDVSLTFIQISKSSLFPEISMNEGQRTSLAFTATMVTLPCMGIAMILPNFFHPDRPGWDVVKSALYYKGFMIGVGIFTLCAWIFLILKVKEQPIFCEVDEPFNLGTALKETFKNKTFLYFLAFNFLLQLCIGLIQPGLPYIITWVLRKQGLVPTIIGACCTLGIIPGTIYTLKVSKKEGVRKPFLTTAICLCFGGIFYTFIDNIFGMIVGWTMLAFALPNAYILYDVAMGEIIDEDEMKTKIRREATYYGINNFAIKPCISIGIAVLNWILAFTNFDETLEVQTDLTVFGMKFAVFGIPGFLMIFGIILMRNYPIDTEYLNKIKNAIAELHQNKIQKLEEMKARGVAIAEKRDQSNIESNGKSNDNNNL
ncbi:MAG: hypothetical protein GF364_12085 [Candidatus Lokiarchaeota archaeon]|nr:hypothetical protein [Candidatus Lokiarchaeota archaeon]